MTPEDFPGNEEGQKHMMGHQGFCAQSALDRDRADWLQECIDRGYIDETTETLMFVTLMFVPIRKYAEEYRRKKCAALLKRLNYPLTRQRAA